MESDLLTRILRITCTFLSFYTNSTRSKTAEVLDVILSKLTARLVVCKDAPSFIYVQMHHQHQGFRQSLFLAILFSWALHVRLSPTLPLDDFLPLLDFGRDLTLILGLENRPKLMLHCHSTVLESQFS